MSVKVFIKFHFSFLYFFFFFFNDTATTEIYTLSLHDALPISDRLGALTGFFPSQRTIAPASPGSVRDRKSTRLNSSHLVISYAVFCLKKKKEKVDNANKEHNNNTMS